MSPPPLDTPDEAHLVITELRPTGTLFAGKEIKRDGSIKSAPQIKQWHHQRRGFDTPKQFYDYLVEAQHRNAIIIRGQTDATKRVVFRRKHCDREPNGFHDRRAALLPFDIDGAAVGPWINDPRKAVAAIVRRLGEPFTSTSYVAQLTGTHGLVRDLNKRWTGEVGGEVMRVRLFFITERGIAADETCAWLDMLRDTRLPEIDASVGRLVQPIFIARPRRHGHAGEDPLGDIRPCWMVRGKRELLPVPDDLTVRTRWRRSSDRVVVRQRLGGVQDVDVQQAVCSIGKPLGEGHGRGSIYEWLLLAARLLAGQHPLNGHDLQTHAWDLRDQLAGIVEQAQEEIVSNLTEHERGNDWPLLQKYLEDDVARWIVWVFEHGATLKKVKRERVERAEHEDDSTEDSTDELAELRELADLVGEDLINIGEDFHQMRVEREETRAWWDALTEVERKQQIKEWEKEQKEKERAEAKARTAGVRCK